MSNTFPLPVIATLEVFFPKIIQPFIYELKNPIHTLGRNKACDIVISSPAISRVHCTFVWRYNKGSPYYQLIDGDRTRRKPSSNGVFVNERRVEEIWERLAHNDVITFGASAINIFYKLINHNEREPTTDQGKETSGGEW